MGAKATKIRQAADRERLAKATTRYFEQLSSLIVVEENALAKGMMSAAQGVQFDQEG